MTKPNSVAIRPVPKNLATRFADAHVVHVGGHMATSEGRLTGADGKLYAHGPTTCSIFEP